MTVAIFAVMAQDGGPLAISVERSPAGPTFVLVGELDLETADSLLAACSEEVLAPGEIITFDCAGLTFLDSVGIRALVELHNQAVEMGVALRMTHVRPAQRRVLEITQLIDVLQVVEGDL
jgi:anti-sigma B factor antagonist